MLYEQHPWEGRNVKTLELLDAVKSRYSLPSDYALAKFLGVKQQTVSEYRRKGNTLSDETALLVADKLKLPAGAVLAWMHAERAKSPAARKVFEKLARQASRSAAALVLGGFMLAGGGNAVSPAPPAAPGHCILCKIRRRVPKHRKLSKTALFWPLSPKRTLFPTFHLSR